MRTADLTAGLWPAREPGRSAGLPARTPRATCLSLLVEGPPPPASLRFRAAKGHE